MNSRYRLLRRGFVLAIASLVLALASSGISAQETDIFASLNRVQNSVDTVWVLLAGFLVFFMQCGFAMLEAGFVRQTGVVNVLMENLVDAGITALMFWAVGFGIAFGADNGSGLFGTDNFFLSGAVVFQEGRVIYDGEQLNTLTLFFFQFAFAATASTIATGAMAERTDFIGNLMYSGIMAALIYPIVVHWVWGTGWLAQRGFLDFAGGTVVHTTGGVLALVGATLLGPRPGRIFGQPPRPHNLTLATLGGMILWLGWYGFNPGSTFGTGDTGLLGLVTVNTTLAAAGGMIAAMLFAYMRSGNWDISCTLNGALGGLVSVTAGCAFFAPWAAVLTGMIAGIVMVLAIDMMEGLRIDDPVSAFAVHGVCGILGTLAVGLLAQPELTHGAGGLLLGGGLQQIFIQAVGSLTIIGFVVIASLLMFGLLRGMGRLRITEQADMIGIDVHEHQATVWPDILNIDVPYEADPEESHNPLY